MEPEFPFEVGVMRNGGYVNGQLIYRQPGGPGTQVTPLPPTVNPPPNWKNSKYPSYPFAYIGLLNFICGHWCNTCEVYTVYDPYNAVQAALCCCPVCSMVQLIVEPAENWWEEFYSLFPVGHIQAGAFPTPITQ